MHLRRWWRDGVWGRRERVIRVLWSIEGLSGRGRSSGRAARECVLSREWMVRWMRGVVVRRTILVSNQNIREGRRMDFVMGLESNSSFERRGMEWKSGTVNPNPKMVSLALYEILLQTNNVAQQIMNSS